MCGLAVMYYLLSPAQNWLCIPNDFCTAKHLYCRSAGMHTGILKGCCSVVGKKSVRVKSIPLYSSKVLDSSDKLEWYENKAIYSKAFTHQMC